MKQGEAITLIELIYDIKQHIVIQKENTKGNVEELETAIKKTEVLQNLILNSVNE